MEYHEIINQRKIHRLCHFTHIENLESIFGSGILSSNYSGIQRNDPDRADGCLGHICTSVEYPNAYYLKQLVERTRTQIEDWVILEIDPGIIDDTSLFCQVNASKGAGRYLIRGVDAFSSLFASSFEIGSESRERNPRWIDCAPTDLQAEVLIYDQIRVESIQGIIFHKCSSMFRIPQNIPKHIRIRYSEDLFVGCKIRQWLDSGRFPYDFKLEV